MQRVGIEEVSLSASEQCDLMQVSLSETQGTEILQNNNNNVIKREEITLRYVQHSSSRFF